MHRGALADQDVTVNWIQSAGSNKANEALRANAIDVGSTAGSAALLARSNGSPIQVIDLYSQAFDSKQLGNAAAIGMVGIVIALIVVVGSRLVARAAERDS